MDPVTQKLVDSRRKSIAKLKKEIEEFKRLAGETSNLARRKVYEGQVQVRSTRCEALECELRALADEAGPELPFVPPKAAPGKR